MVYRVSIPSAIQTVDDIRAWAEGEFQALEQDLGQLDYLRLRPLARDIVKPREGTLIYADGTNFNPGLGEGVYVYKDGAWRYILSNYGDGTWTPTLVGSTTAGTQGYGVQLGKWVKHGSLVFVGFRISIGAFSGTATGDMKIAGLPFSLGPLSFDNQAVALSTYTGMTFPAGYTDLTVRCIEGTTTMNIIRNGSGVVQAFVQGTELSGSVEISGSGTYYSTA